MSILLDVQSLNKSFGGIKATDNLSLQVERGEIHAIIGPNGAGKTTLISQLAGSLSPDSGSIYFNGKDIAKLPAYKRAQIGFSRSYQITSLMLDLTVEENLILALMPKRGHSFRFFRPLKNHAQLYEKSAQYLQQVGLFEKAGLKARMLSHGEHRRLEIAIALASSDSLLLLDEPMAGLGPEETSEMVSLLKNLKGERSILMIEHDMDAVFALADRISVLVYGHIIATDRPEVIKENEDVQHAYLGDMEELGEDKE